MADELLSAILQKATSIGPSQVGDRYLPTERPTTWSLIKQYLLGGEERPPSVAAKDPFGIDAWDKGAGAMPQMFLGATENVSPLAKQLYSRLTRAFESAPERMPVAKAASIAKNAASKDEIQWRKLPDFLQGKQVVGKGEVLGHLQENPIDLKVSRRGEEILPNLTDVPTDLLIQPPSSRVIPTKFNRPNLVVPGGKNYREDLIQLNPRQNHNIAGFQDWAKKKYAIDDVDHLSADNYSFYLDSYIDEAAGGTDPKFTSGHFEEPNVLAHVRHDERRLPATSQDLVSQKELVNDVIQTDKAMGVDTTPTDFVGDARFGSKGRLIEEIQSDWHQKGKASGYREPYSNQDAARYEELMNKAGLPGGNVLGPEEQAQLIDLTRRRFQPSEVVPDAPFKESWPDLALKQQLLDVADRPDLEWLGMTTGQTQADRYNLSKHISEVSYDPKLKRLAAYDHSGANVLDTVVEPEEIAQHIGHETANKLLATTPPQLPPIDGNSWTPSGIHILQGQNLDVGGEGMKHFYDELLPSRLQKLLKPFGGTVEKGKIPAEVPARLNIADDGTQLLYPAKQEIEAWIAKLPPEMKQRIKKEGFPLLSALLSAYVMKQQGHLLPSKGNPQD